MGSYDVDRGNNVGEAIPGGVSADTSEIRKCK